MMVVVVVQQGDTPDWFTTLDFVHRIVSNLYQRNQPVRVEVRRNTVTTYETL